MLRVTVDLFHDCNNPFRIIISKQFIIFVSILLEKNVKYIMAQKIRLASQELQK